ncbi:MAG: hypothetical protein BWX47_00839 [candidate division Hyd24-12 bacterium ADurb.Bin004]|nr:MAG: hypothetical protein BWX47_00839 [candidate division Hyd24-12 bacterium ADurb.Bin004]
MPVLLAVLAYVPGVFDSTYNSRLAIYPLAGAAMMLGGASGISRRFMLAAAALPALQIVGLIPGGAVPGAIPQIVRWISFWMMLCGAHGMLATHGRRSVFGGMVLPAVLMACLSLVLPDDMPSGNPNRQGPMLALSILAVAAGIIRPGRIAGAVILLLLAAGLLKSGFYTAMISVVCAAGWLLLRRNSRTSMQGIPIVAAILFQSMFLFFPQSAASINPSLELRALMWRSGFSLLERAGPGGTGTAVSRIGLMTGGSDRMQALAGPDRRIDFIHSEILSLPVEQGIAGGIAALAFVVLCVKRKMTPVRGSVLLCCWPFLTVDLPLATPLGAIPLAIGLAWASGGGGKRMESAAMRRGAVIALLLSLPWAAAVLIGNGFLERGIRAGAAGRNAESAGLLRNASILLPWEERTHYYRALALARGSNFEDALRESRSFLEMYPSYWRAWALEGDLLAAAGRREEAAWSYLQAILTAPAGTDSLELMAFNAAATPPADTAHAVILASILTRVPAILPSNDPTLCIEFARRAAGVARALPPYRVVLITELVKESMAELTKASSLNGFDGDSASVVIRSLEPLMQYVPEIDRPPCFSVRFRPKSSSGYLTEDRGMILYFMRKVLTCKEGVR